MTLKQIADMGFKEVHVKSYGYESAGLFSHYEPFGNKAREFVFKLAVLEFDDETYIDLEHRWLFFINENKEDFYIKDDQAWCDDPELKEVPSNNY